VAWIDLLGYSASFSVFGTFCMKKMVALRVLAVISNILFALYGYYGQLHPILLLHLALLPVNVFRFVQLLWGEPAEPVSCRAGSFSRNFSPPRVEGAPLQGGNEPHTPEVRNRSCRFPFNLTEGTNAEPIPLKTLTYQRGAYSGVSCAKIQSRSRQTSRPH
jgi:hypothetical protein